MGWLEGTPAPMTLPSRAPSTFATQQCVCVVQLTRTRELPLTADYWRSVYS